MEVNYNKGKYVSFLYHQTLLCVLTNEKADTICLLICCDRLSQLANISFHLRYFFFTLNTVVNDFTFMFKLKVPTSFWDIEGVWIVHWL